MDLSWPDFKATPAGSVIFNNGYAECVAVVNRLNEDVLGLPFIEIQSASQLWSRRGTEKTLRENYVASSVPVPGAIPVWVGANWNAQHGHTGVVIAVGADGSFTTLEQNAGPKARDTYQHVRNVNDAGLQGFLVPISNPAVAPTINSILEDQMANPIISVPDKNGTLYIGNDRGEFVAYATPRAANSRGIISKAFFGGPGGNTDTIPALSWKDFDVAKTVWRQMCTGK